jgi:hypothetical protein
VTDIRKEIVRKYRQVEDGKAKPGDAYTQTQMLMNAAKLMTETEPEIEVRRLVAENAELREELAALKAEMDEIRKGPAWASWQQHAKPAAILPS